MVTIFLTRFWKEQWPLSQATTTRRLLQTISSGTTVDNLKYFLMITGKNEKPRVSAVGEKRNILRFYQEKGESQRISWRKWGPWITRADEVVAIVLACAEVVAKVKYILYFVALYFPGDYVEPSSGLSGGEIAGIVIGVILLLTIVTVAVVFVLHRMEIIEVPFLNKKNQKGKFWGFWRRYYGNGC